MQKCRSQKAERKMRTPWATMIESQGAITHSALCTFHFALSSTLIRRSFLNRAQHRVEDGFGGFDVGAFGRVLPDLDRQACHTFGGEGLTVHRRHELGEIAEKTGRQVAALGAVSTHFLHQQQDRQKSLVHIRPAGKGRGVVVGKAFESRARPLAKRNHECLELRGGDRPVGPPPQCIHAAKTDFHIVGKAKRFEHVMQRLELGPLGWIHFLSGRQLRGQAGYKCKSA